MGRASISMRTLSPAVSMTNLPGIDEALFGAYRSAEPISIILFRFLNLSPPCAANAARASSIGVEAAVITGAAGIAFDAAVAAPLDFAASGPWATAAELIRSKTKSGAYLFIAGFLPRRRIETAVRLLYAPPLSRVQKLSLRLR